MPPRDRLLAALVVVIWGLNFLAIQLGVEVFDPFFFAALRFGVIAVPVLLFVPRPEVETRWLVLCALGWGVGQFAFLFTAMHAGLPPGLASLVVQSSVPFTVILGALVLGERMSSFQVGGLAVALTGLGLVIVAQHSGPVGLVPLALGLGAGFSWAVGNIATRKAASSQPLRLTLWMCTLATLPLLALSAAIEGPTAGWRELVAAFSNHEGHLALLGLLYISSIGTVVGSGLYMSLMSRHPASVVAPLSLLVPVVGIAASAVIFDERPVPLALVGGVLVIAGAVATQRRRTKPTPGPLGVAPPPAEKDLSPA